MATKKKVVPKVVVDESTGYENCIGVKETDILPSTLHEFLGENPEDDESPNPNDWKKHWHGMPEYVQEDNPPHRKLYISFRTDEDFFEFAKLITDQKITEKTKSIWFPHLDRDANSLKRWMEEE